MRMLGYPFEIDPGPGTMHRLSRRSAGFVRARSVMRYDDGSKKLILALKRADGSIWRLHSAAGWTVPDVRCWQKPT